MIQYEILHIDGFHYGYQWPSIELEKSCEIVIVNSTREINADLPVVKDYKSIFKKEFRDFVTSLRKSNANRIVIVIFNTWFKDYSEVFEDSGANEIIYLDLFLYDTYRKLIIHKYSEVVNEYILNQENKFLFLVNKPASIHRIGLIYKLAQKQLLDSALYSFIIHNDFTEKICRNLLSFLSIEEFDNFYHQNKNSLDLEYDPNVVKATKSTHYTGIPYDCKLFENVNFQLVSETHFDCSVWITEKTWISIVNKRPFIISAYPGFLKRLNKIGFKTFENYMIDPKYNEIDEDLIQERLYAIVKNVEYWNNNIQKYHKDIVNDTNYNYQRFLEIAKENENKLLDFFKRYDLQIDIDFFRGYENRTDEIWYTGIKEKEQK
jgi:hypothetical protein